MLSRAPLCHHTVARVALPVLVPRMCACACVSAEHDIPKWTGDSSGEEEGGESDATEEGGSGPWVPNPADAAQLGIPPPNHRFPCGTAVEAKVALADGEAPAWRPGQITGVSSQDEGASFRFFSYSVMPWRGPGTVTSDSVWVKPEHVRCAPAEPFRVGQRVEVGVSGTWVAQGGVLLTSATFTAPVPGPAVRQGGRRAKACRGDP